MALSDFPKFIRKNYEIHEWRHASAVLHTDFREEWEDIVAVLTKFRVKKNHITVGGGGRSQFSASIDRAFTERGWRERKFATQIRVDESVFDSPTHKVDCFKNGIGVELEWNNKTEFYDRDVNSMDLRTRSRLNHQMQTLVIEVRGGVVQEVYCDAENIRVIKVDWDAGESPGDAFVAGKILVQPMSILPDETRKAVATV